MKRSLVTAGAAGLAILIAAIAAPSGAERAYFAGLLAPALLALILPFGLAVERDLRSDAVLPPVAGLAAFLALAGFSAKIPGLAPALLAALFLASWSALVVGLFRTGSRFGAPAGHLLAGGAGLFLCATHLLFDSVVSAAENVAFRRFVISFTLDANPSLIMSASFWERDLLMRAYVYARSDIGAFHAHGYAGWGWVALAYLGVGAAGWLAGKRKEESAEE